MDESWEESLPVDYNFETPEIMRALVSASANLAELKRVENILPNPRVLIALLSLKEAQK